MRLSHCLTWSVVSVQERTELPMAPVRQKRLLNCLPWSVFLYMGGRSCPRHLSDRYVYHIASHDLLFLCRRGRSYLRHLSNRCVCHIAYNYLLFLYSGRHRSDDASVTFLTIICCFCAGEDGVAQDCQTDASIRLPHMICCFCTGEDGVAHGICQTDAGVIIAYHDLLFLCRWGRSCPRHLANRCVCHIAYNYLLFLYRRGQSCLRHLSNRCVCHIAYHDLLYLCRRGRSCPRHLSDRCERHHCLAWPRAPAGRRSTPGTGNSLQQPMRNRSCNFSSQWIRLIPFKFCFETKRNKPKSALCALIFKYSWGTKPHFSDSAASFYNKLS